MINQYSLPDSTRPRTARSVRFLSLAVAAFGALTATVYAKKDQAQKPLPRIGEATIAGVAVKMEFRSFVDKGFSAQLDGRPVVVTTARYDLTAPHVALTVRNKLIQTGNATGGVRVVARNPEQHQLSTLDCTEAQYAGAVGEKPAHLHLIGPVHAVMQDPQLAQPLDVNSESGDVFLLADGTNDVILTNGTAKGTPIEPPAKKKAAAP